MTKAPTSGTKNRAKKSTPAADAPVYVPRVLPRGTNSLPRDVVLLSQRSRLIEATAHAVAEKGYAETAVADIISRAGVSRTTFYQQFKDKEDCFLFCFEQQSQRHLERMLAALAIPGSPPRRFYRAMEAYLACLTEDGIYSAAFFAEAVNGGERVQESWSRSKEVVLGEQRAWYRSVKADRSDLVELPDLVFELINEGMRFTIINQIRSGNSDNLLELLPVLAYFAFSSMGIQDWAKSALNGDILLEP